MMQPKKLRIKCEVQSSYNDRVMPSFSHMRPTSIPRTLHCFNFPISEFLKRNEESGSTTFFESENFQFSANTEQICGFHQIMTCLLEPWFEKS